MLAQESRAQSAQSQGIDHLILWQKHLQQEFQISRQLSAAALQWSSGGTFPEPQYAVAAAFVPKENVKPDLSQYLICWIALSIHQHIYHFKSMQIYIQ